MRQVVRGTAGWLTLAVALAGAGACRAADETAADEVTIRDGDVLRGQVADVGRFGEMTVVARRAWVRENLAEPARVWERLEAERVRQARLQRRERIVSWRRDRVADLAGDPLPNWLNRETTALTTMQPPQTLLMRVHLDRAAVRSVARRDAETARLMRFAWRLGLEDPEAIPVDELRQTLEDRNALPPDDPAPVDDLLPLASESEASWRLRRAATEAAVEDGLRFVQFRELILPESGPEVERGEPATAGDLLDSLGGREAFAAINGVRVDNAVSARLDEAADRGRIGAIVSRVTLSADSAEASTALWVRQESGGWSSVLSKRATVRVGAPAEPGEPIADRTPIRSALLVLESVAASPSPPEVRRQTQAAGYAGQRALGRARFALDREMSPYLLPVIATRR